MPPRVIHPVAVGFVGLGIAATLAGCSTSTTDTSSIGTPSTTTASPADPSPSATTDSGSSTGTTYKDGTYTEDGDYVSPGGPESVTVKLTIAADKVTAVTVTGHPGDPTAKGYQSQFIGGISDVVVGKDLDSLKVSRVAGSSLTSGGFNKALAAIKADAKA